MGPRSLLGKEHTRGVQGSFWLSLSLFKSVNCHLPTPSGCSLPGPSPATHTRTTLPPPAHISLGSQPGEGEARPCGRTCLGPSTPTHSWAPEVPGGRGRWPRGGLRQPHPLRFLPPPWAARPSLGAQALANRTGGPRPSCALLSLLRAALGDTRDRGHSPGDLLSR